MGYGSLITPGTTDAGRTNAPHLTTVWVQKVDQPRTALAWSADSMMSSYHWFVAVDEHGREQRKP